jgi:DNA-directed RNA polymerase specialized sigma54-like protein
MILLYLAWGLWKNISPAFAKAPAGGTDMTQINTDLIPAINDSLEISLPAEISLKELKETLAVHINHLINHDFEKLVSLLYRIDVNENKIRQLLKEKEPRPDDPVGRGENAAGLIADLIIERQLQKIESRKKSAKNENISDEEKW